MKDRIFISGIGTNVGKTFVSAVICNNYGHAYWKPVQTGSESDSDSNFVRTVIGNEMILPETYTFFHPVSPDWAAKLEDTSIELENLFPLPSNDKLCVEGAGGILVPLNRKHTYLDFLGRSELHPVIVIRHYLGSINHSLLTLGILEHAGFTDYTIVWNGNEHKPSEESILLRHRPKHVFRLQETNELELGTVTLRKEV